MMSTLPHILRRPLPSTSFSLYTQYARRWASKGGVKQKRALAAHLRKEAKKKQTEAGSGTKNAPKTRSSATPPPPQELPRAPHMQIKSVSNKDGSFLERLIGHVMRNPVPYAMFVFPTMITGALLIFKPSIRPEWLVGGGDKIKDKEDTNFNDAKEALKETPAAVYESEDSLKKEEEEWEIVQASEGTLATTPNDEEVAVAVEKEVSRPSGENETTVDLFYALGIRPHSSS